MGVAVEVDFGVSCGTADDDSAVVIVCWDSLGTSTLVEDGKSLLLVDFSFGMTVVFIVSLLSSFSPLLVIEFDVTEMTVGILDGDAVFSIDGCFKREKRIR